MEEIIRDICKKVFNNLGGGYKENVYQNAICYELRSLGIQYHKELNIPVLYDNCELGTVRIDLLVNKEYVVEIKCVKKLGEKETNQVKRYLKLLGKSMGFLINFNLNSYEIIIIE